jgi:hypothetical protein
MGKKTSIALLFVILLIMLLCMINIVVPILLLKYLPFFGTLMKFAGLNSPNASTMLLISLSIFLTSYFVKKIKIIAFNLGFLFLVLASIEIFYNIKDTWFADKHCVAEKHTTGFWHYSHYLGYTLSNNFVDHCIGSNRDSIIYDVRYSGDKYGFRKTPEITPDKSTKSIVFFGCSYTFGTGLNDAEVMPNIVQETVKNKYKVYNFALIGYGTQHMLALTEFNIIDTIINYEPKKFIYIAINDHIMRIIGNYHYCRLYQKYILNTSTGEPKNVGRFDKNHCLEWIRDLGISKLLTNNKIQEADFKLFGAMVLKSKKLLLTKYPNSEFHVLFWDLKDYMSNKMIKELQERNIKTHLVTNIVPDYLNNINSFHIWWPYENHPNYKINKLIANYIVTNIIETPNKDSVKSSEDITK